MAAVLDALVPYVAEERRRSRKEEKASGCLQPPLFGLRNPAFAHHMGKCIKEVVGKCIKELNAVGKCIKELNARLDDIHREMADFEFVKLDAYTRPSHKVTSLLGVVVGEQIERDTKALVQELLTEEPAIKVVSIVGFGGMGKSTLAKIFNHDAVQAEFKSKHIWLSVIESYNRDQLLSSAITQADGGNDPRGDKQVLLQINKALVQELLTEELAIMVVPIVGLGGMGKSTLAKKIFNHDAIQAEFKSKHIWLSVTESYNGDQLLSSAITQADGGNDPRGDKQVLSQRNNIFRGWLLACLPRDDTNNPLLIKLSPEETGSIPRPGDYGACHSPTTDANANHESNNITSSEGARSMPTGGNHHRGTDPSPKENPVVILDSEAPETTTGNLSVLSSGTMHRHDGVLSPASGEEMQTYTPGSVCFGGFKLNGVKYNPNVGNRIIVSGSELDKLDYYFEFGQGECIVLDLRSDEIVGKGRLVDEDYIMEYLEIPHNRAPESESLFSLE